MKTNTRDTVLYDTRKNNETINNTNIKTLYDVAADCISEKGIIASDDEITNVNFIWNLVILCDLRTAESTLHGRLFDTAGLLPDGQEVV